jgi:transcriptional regulator with XRE-family HTH domain
MDFFSSKDFGEYIKTLRKSMKLSRDIVAEQTGLHKDTIRKIEIGATIPKLETLQLLSIALKADLLSEVSKYHYLNTDSFHQLTSKSISNLLNDEISKLETNIQLYLDSNRGDKKVDSEVLVLSLEKEITLLKVIKLFNTTKKESLEDSLHKIFKHLEDINYDIITPKRLDYCDVRLSLIISDLYRRLNQLDKSEEILILLEQKIKESVFSEKIETELLLLIYTNLAQVYHRKDNYNEIIRYADLGIDLSYKTNNILTLHLFYLRKAHALEKLNDKKYIDIYNKALMSLVVQDKIDLLKTIIKVVIKTYPDVYDNLMENVLFRSIIDEYA